MSKVAVIGAIVRHRDRVLSARLDRLAESDVFHRHYKLTNDDHPDGPSWQPQPNGVDYLAALDRLAES